MFFVGADFVGGVSTEYGVCMPTMSYRAGMDFNKFQLEYKVGNFNRNMLTISGVDAQYSNFCTDLGQNASVKNAMQLSLIKGGFKGGFGHQGGSSFYEFTQGNWYAYANQQICKNLSLCGGINFGEISGFASAKVNSGNNNVTMTANQLGTDSQNLVVTYNRDNISVGRNKIMLSTSAWFKGAEQGLHLVASLIKGKGTFFAQLGTNFCANGSTPYCGLGTNINF